MSIPTDSVRFVFFSPNPRMWYLCQIHPRIRMTCHLNSWDWWERGFDIYLDERSRFHFILCSSRLIYEVKMTYYNFCWGEKTTSSLTKIFDFTLLSFFHAVWYLTPPTVYIKWQWYLLYHIVLAYFRQAYKATFRGIYWALKFHTYWLEMPFCWYLGISCWINLWNFTHVWPVPNSNSSKRPVKPPAQVNLLEWEK